MSTLADKVHALHAGLEAAGLPHAFGGALALGWCTDQPRATSAIDLNVFVPTAAVRRVLEAMPASVQPTAQNQRELRRDGQSRLWLDTTPVDVFLNTHAFHRQAMKRTSLEPFAGTMRLFLSCAALAVLKSFFNRRRDWAALEDTFKLRTAEPEVVIDTLENSHGTVTLAPETAALVDDAAAEVARFDADMGHEIAPFASVLLRSESAASSKIENLTASARAIAVAELTPDAPGNGRLIVANVHAMTAAISLAGRLDADAVLQMHRALLGDANPSAAGRWRDEQVWIGGSDYGPHGADYVAPHHSRVEAAIDDLVRFIDREDVPILAHAALAHAQFETIHP